MRSARTLAVTAAAAGVLSCPLVGVGAPAFAAASGTVTQVASGLDNPRSLVFASDGRLYVADSGRGGSECPSQATGPEGQQCAGLTGAIVRIVNGRAEVVVPGFVSVASPQGAAASGIAGLAAQGDALLAQIGLSSQQVPPGFSASLGGELRRTLGHTVRVDVATQTVRLVADPGGAAFVWTNGHKSLNPDFPDANPYAVGLGPDGGALVIDAGANTVTSIARGTSTVRRLMPSFGTGDAVPTCMAVGPDRALYIGTLGAGGNKPGAARIYRFAPGGPLTVWRTGFTTVTGCGFDRAGNFYATELQTAGLNPGPNGDPKGALVKVTPGGTRTVLGVGSLFYPQGFALAPDGRSVYLSNWSILPGTPMKAGGPTGSVVRVSL